DRDGDVVPQRHADAIAPESPGQLCEHGGTIVQANAKVATREHLGDLANQRYEIVTRHSGPYRGRTLAAWSPLGPWITSNCTRWPSDRLRNPSAWIAVWCTNTSGPFSCVMKPKPLASLNHLTVPCCTIKPLCQVARRESRHLFVAHAVRGNVPGNCVSTR